MKWEKARRRDQGRGLCCVGFSFHKWFDLTLFALSSKWAVELFNLCCVGQKETYSTSAFISGTQQSNNSRLLLLLLLLRQSQKAKEYKGRLYMSNWDMLMVNGQIAIDSKKILSSGYTRDMAIQPHLSIPGSMFICFTFHCRYPFHDTMAFLCSTPPQYTPLVTKSRWWFTPSFALFSVTPFVFRGIFVRYRASAG